MRFSLLKAISFGSFFVQRSFASFRRQILSFFSSSVVLELLSFMGLLGIRKFCRFIGMKFG